jgi:hypothetical protein
MDRGFYCESNVDVLCVSRMGFVLGIPHCVWLDEIYDRCREKVFQPFNRRDSGENEALYVLMQLHK